LLLLAFGVHVDGGAEVTDARGVEKDGLDIVRGEAGLEDGGEGEGGVRGAVNEVGAAVGVV